MDWRVSTWSEKKGFVEESHPVVVDGGITICHLHPCPATPREKLDEYARLIAAAPDLLAALVELREWHKMEYQSNQWIDARVDAAIAKAQSSPAPEGEIR